MASHLPVAQAVISGKTIYVSGSIGITRDMKLVDGGVQAQTVSYDLRRYGFHLAYRQSRQRAALENMTKVLKGAGVGLESVLKANIYLTNLARDFAPMNEVYLEVSLTACTFYMIVRSRQLTILRTISSSPQTRRRVRASASPRCRWGLRSRLSASPSCPEARRRHLHKCTITQL